MGKPIKLSSALLSCGIFLGGIAVSLAAWKIHSEMTMLLGLLMLGHGFHFFGRLHEVGLEEEK